ncbi:MAG: prepilin-type N-terminal cleavage/methylation domain-containing protein [Lachnospiraceae bacterium]|nr:prepilin-type N-terminal cleavage/methylation domain-containing protein [Lachnospiraceae bacterium]
MLKLIQKRNNKKGFTLAELLIVVAIIAVLVAISIPIFTAQLEKSREATDLANQRAAKAAAVAAYLDADSTGTQTYYYDAASGAVKSDKDKITGYGKGTDHVGSASNTQDGYDPQTSYVGKLVKVTITEATAASEGTAAKDQGITVTWEK